MVECDPIDVCTGDCAPDPFPIMKIRCCVSDQTIHCQVERLKPALHLKFVCLVFLR